MCKTVIEIFDGPMDVKKNLIGKMCSSQDKSNNNFDFDTKKILSSGNELVIYFQRPTIPQATNEAEFIAGRYFFHDGKQFIKQNNSVPLIAKKYP